MNLVDQVNKDHENPNMSKFPEFRTGDTVSVSVRIQEGAKTRIQLFEGTCISMKGKNTLLLIALIISIITSSNSLSQEAKSIPDNSINLVEIDPPYSINLGKVKKKK